MRVRRANWRALWVAGLMTLAALVVRGVERIALPGFMVRGWSVEDGVPQSLVSGVALTPDGYCWFGTEQGLVRFDGVRFVVLNTGNTPSLGDDRINCLHVDSSGELWVGTEAGTLARRTQTGFESVPMDARMSGSGIGALAGGAPGELWVGVKKGGVARRHDDAWTVYTAAQGLPQRRVSQIVRDRAEQPWALTDGGLVVFRNGVWEMPEAVRNLGTVQRIGPARDGGLWISVNVTPDSGGRVFHLSLQELLTETGDYPWRQDSPRSKIWAFWEDKAGRLWAGSFWNGVYYWWEGRWHLLTSEGALSENIVTGLTGDGRDGLWITLKNGLIYHVRDRLVDHLSLPKPYERTTVMAACASRDGSLWIGTEESGVFRQRGAEMKRFSKADGLSREAVNVVYEDSRTNLWVGTRNGLFRFDGQRFQLGHPRIDQTLPVLSLHEDRAGNFWVGTTWGLLRIHKDQEKWFTPLGQGQYQEASSIAEDTNGCIWVSINGVGLFRLQDEAFVHFGHGQWAGEGDFQRVYADREGALWITTASYTGGNGLFELKDGLFRQWTSKDGLPSDKLQSLTEDLEGRLWIGSTYGIFGCNKSELEDYQRSKGLPLSGWRLTVADGMEDYFCSGVGNPIIARTPDGRLWFPNQRVVSVFDPAKVTQAEPLPLEPLIEEVLTDGVVCDVSAAHPLRFKSGVRSLEIHYTVPELLRPERLRFRYRLVGFDADWQNAGTRRTAYYGRLPPGSYEFELTCNNMQGAWRTAVQRLPVIVAPVWWERTSVRAFMMLALLAATGTAAGALARARSRRRLAQLDQQRSLERERRRIAQDIHDDLGGSLTQISLYGELLRQDLAETARAAGHVAAIGSTVRQIMKSMDEIVWAVNPQNDTLPSLIDYLGQFAVDFVRAAGLRCVVELPDHPPERAVSSSARHNTFLVAKEALNNVIRHAHASQVRLAVHVDEDAIRVSIEDDGQGFESGRAAAGADGLRNMHQRMASIGGECSVTSQPGSGTKVEFTVPLEQR